MRRRLQCALTSWLLASWLFPLFVQAQPVVGPSSSAAGANRNDWYWASPVNIHWDNHGNPLGQGMSVDDIVKLFAGIKVDMIQVSARSGYTTYPSQVGVPNPKLAGYDTLATWREVTRRLGTRLWIYINVIDEPYLIDKHPDWQRVDAQGQQVAGLQPAQHRRLWLSGADDDPHDPRDQRAVSAGRFLVRRGLADPGRVLLRQLQGSLEAGYGQGRATQRRQGCRLAAVGQTRTGTPGCVQAEAGGGDPSGGWPLLLHQQLVLGDQPTRSAYSSRLCRHAEWRCGGREQPGCPVRLPLRQSRCSRPRSTRRTT